MFAVSIWVYSKAMLRSAPSFASELAVDEANKYVKKHKASCAIDADADGELFFQKRRPEQNSLQSSDVLTLLKNAVVLSV